MCQLQLHSALTAVDVPDKLEEQPAHCCRNPDEYREVYMCGNGPWLSVTKIKSAVYVMNSIGPNTDPC